MADAGYPRTRSSSCSRGQTVGTVRNADEAQHFSTPNAHTGRYMNDEDTENQVPRVKEVKFAAEDASERLQSGSTHSNVIGDPSSVEGRDRRRVLVLPESQRSSSLGINGTVHVDYGKRSRRQPSLEASIRRQTSIDGYGGHAENGGMYDKIEFDESSRRQLQAQAHGRSSEVTSDVHSIENSRGQSHDPRSKSGSTDKNPRPSTPPPLEGSIEDTHEYYIKTDSKRKPQKYRGLGSSSVSSSRSSISRRTSGIDLHNDMTSCATPNKDSKKNGEQISDERCSSGSAFDDSSSD
eukprot:gb/GECG01014112.1/.p1 GENE.gb/GECG01014112.1/~~gb/GECG01014112.1/.p1  ORF type:complete len:294 (+),score=40.44 gb/GECG01014112.1/:1-882(+)